MSTKTYSVGIDLGTTNCVLGYAPIGQPDSKVELLPIPQITAPGTVENRFSLPSFIYLAPETEAKNYALPWAVAGQNFAVGEYARKQSADVPTRSVAAAKSWLCHSRVDRHEPILPWNAPEDVVKVSPVEATRLYLAHLQAAWDHAFPDSPLADQHVVLTVPASFDASARDLTREAALEAGLPKNLILLEEPQAAVYAWLADSGNAWRKQLGEGDTLLVCDIGGGTTDFTLIRAAAEDGELALKRVAVGNHILVGGDNMDLAIAFTAREGFAEKGTEVDAWQSVALWHACRAAKESLFSPKGPAKHPVTVLGRGRKLVGATISVDLDRENVAEMLLEGFFPACAADEKPARRRAAGLREIGLPYESDTAITRHLANFLTLQASEKDESIRPTRVLFNGGVLKAGALRTRLLEVLGSWFSEAPVPLEGTPDLDFAVARGAAYYGALADGSGMRIRGGTARTYYVGIETAGLAVPGAMRPLQLLTVVPFGMEEGTSLEVPSEEFGLIVGEPAHFRFFSSPVRKEDVPGTILSRWSAEEISETDSLETTLSSAKGSEDGFVPVRFESRVTELGVLEFWCVSQVSDERWKLEFSVREE